MPDGADALASELASIRRRLSNLETAPRAPHTSVAGKTRFLPTDGTANRAVVVGSSDNLQSDSGVGVQVGVETSEFEIYAGTVGGVAELQALNPDGGGGRALLVSGGKMLAPLITAAWQRSLVGVDAVGLATVTSATYTTCWSSLITAQTGILWWSFATGPSDGATTSDFRIVCSEIISGSEQVLHESIGLTSLVTDQASATIPDNALNPARSPVGERILLRAQVRRTAGAGNALVAPLLPVSNWP